MQMIF